MTTETTTPTMEPTAAAEAPAQESTSAPETPRNARTVREEARQRASGNIAAQVNKLPDRPRDEAGRFASTEPVTPSEPAQTPATAATAPNGRTPLPDTDPLRSRGKQYVEDLNPAEFRSLINRVDTLPEPVLRSMAKMFDAQTQTVHATAEQTAQQNATIARERLEAQRELARAQAQAQAWQGAAEAFFGSPETALYYAELQQINPEVAEAFKRGKLAELQEKITERQGEAEQSFAMQQAEQQTHELVTEAYRTSRERNIPDWWLAERLRTEAALFGKRLELTTRPEDTIPREQLRDMLSTHLLNAYTSDPRVAPYLQKHISDRRASEQQAILANAQAQAQKAAEAAQRQAMEEAAARGRNNPLGRIPASAHTGQNAMPVSVGPRTAREAREMSRNRSSGRV